MFQTQLLQVQQKKMKINRGFSAFKICKNQLGCLHRRGQKGQKGQKDQLLNKMDKYRDSGIFVFDDLT